jgi:hypothetical protein
MSSIFELLDGAQNGALVANIAHQFDSPVGETNAALKAVVEELAYNIDRNTLSNGGLSELVHAIGDGHHTRYLDEPDLLGSETMRADGNAILGHITGSKSASRRIAARTARETGLAPDTIEKMLPTFAALTMAGLAQQTRGPLADLMRQMTGGDASHPTTSPQSAISGEADIGQHQPLPLPGDHVPGLDGKRSTNPFDDFSDVIRGGRRRTPKGGGNGESGGGGTLWRMIRSIIASALGLRGSSGVMGWIVRFLIYRYGWRIVSSIFRRLAFGR